MAGLLVFCTSLCVAAAPPSPKAPAGELPRLKSAALPEGALARFGSDRLTILRPVEAVAFAADGKELQAWDGQALHRWELPSGRPLGRSALPRSANPTGQPLALPTLSPRRAQLAWVRFHDGKERLRAWDFRQNKLVLDRDITLEDKELDYTGLAYSEDGEKLIAFRSDKQALVLDLRGEVVGKTRVVDGKGGPELASGERTSSSGPITKGLVARTEKSLVRVTLDVDRRAFEVARGLGRPGHLLTFTDLGTGKSASVKVALDLQHPGQAAVSQDGRHLALVDESRLRVWDVATRRELSFGQALPRIGQMVVSPGGAYVQFQRDPVSHPGAPWHSLRVASGRLLRLKSPSSDGIPIVPSPTAPAPSGVTRVNDGITLGLGPTGFALGKDQFIGITGRSVDRWALDTGRRLGGVRLPGTPHERGFGRGYDECLLLGDGFRLLQFACIPKRRDKSGVVYDSTWRFWSPERKGEPLKRIPECTWQRGAAALPQGRFLYFATLPEKPTSKDTEPQPGFLFRERGDTQLFLGRLSLPGPHHPGDFSGQWPELRGASRRGHLLLLAEQSSSWYPSSRQSRSNWYDPAAMRHALLEFHSGAPVVDPKKLGKVIDGRASHLSADGRFLLLAGDNSLRLYEPHVLGKVVKELALPATPVLFAVSPDSTRVACQLDDATLVIWDGRRLARFVDEALAKERPKALSALVGDLSASPTAAYRAARLLSAAGEPGVAALRRAMDGKAPTGGQIAGWIRDLGSDESATRERAESALAGWGAPVDKALRDALRAGPSAEKRQRLRRLLARLTRCPYGDRELAQARAVLALDWSASPAAARLLAEWADKYPDSVLGAESRFALANGPVKEGPRP
jgi:hypothetical protein